jgi:hypothetical protein
MKALTTPAANAINSIIELTRPRLPSAASREPSHLGMLRGKMFSAGPEDGGTWPPPVTNWQRGFVQRSHAPQNERDPTQRPGAFRKHAPGLTGRCQRKSTSRGYREPTPLESCAACGRIARAIAACRPPDSETGPGFAGADRPAHDSPQIRHASVSPAGPAIGVLVVGSV